MQIYKKENGFTLVELAIALMVIGLLIGGVLKGQELIENARITATVKQLRDYDTAVMIFYSIYDALPGDILNPGERIPNCTSDLCADNTSNDSRGDGKITLTIEASQVFLHLSAAGLINESFNEEDNRIYPYLKVAPDQSNIKLSNNCLFYCSRSGHNPHYYMTGNATGRSMADTGGISGRKAEKLDMKMDDGNPTSGNITAVNTIDAGCNDESVSRTPISSYGPSYSSVCSIAIRSSGI